MLTNVPSATLRELVKLSERKEKLLAQIQEIDREMVRWQSKAGTPVRNPAVGARVTVTTAKPRPKLAK